jgi:hypothetical protein
MKSSVAIISSKKTASAGSGQNSPLPDCGQFFSPVYILTSAWIRITVSGRISLADN